MNNERKSIDTINIKRERANIDSENYQRMYNNSVNGNSARRTHRKKKTKYGTSHKKLKLILGAAVVGAAVTVGITNFTTQMRDNAIVNGLVAEFDLNVINKETQRTDDYEGYYYDYIDIAQTIKGMDNFDEGVYCLVQAIGEDQADRVLEYTDYESFANYKEVKGYEDTDEFRKDVKKKILLEEGIENNKQELERMLQADEDENINVKASEIGGK